MKTEQIIQNAVDENPEVRLILEIAARAREAESKEAPRDFGSSSEVTTIPTNPQYPVSPLIIG